MTARSRLLLATLGGLSLFIGIVGGGLAIGYLSAPMDTRGAPSESWMLGAFVIAVTLATTALFAIGRAMGRKSQQLAARQLDAANQQLRAEQAARVASLRVELQSIPDLARYATIVDQAPWLASVEQARRREELVQRLIADTRTAPYAERAFRGGEITDALIAHWQDPERPLTCEHLRSLEAALRSQLDRLMPLAEHHLRVYANLDGAVATLRRGASTTDIDYEVEEELPGLGRDPFEGRQTLRCSRCGCRIDGSLHGPNLLG